MAGEIVNPMPVSRHECFSQRVEDGVAILTFDDPRESVNTLSPETLGAFAAHLAAANAEEGVRALVLLSGKKDSFIAGAKLEYLQGLTSAQAAEEASREGQRALNALEQNPKPLVAAIHGSCLGGGLEWALAARYRVGTDSPKTGLGVPEVQLGLLPGAGGTQRLPRLVGVQAALDLILTGKTVKAQKARRLGLLDEVVPLAILRDVAVRRARELADGALVPERRHGLIIPRKGRGLSELLRGLARKEAWAELALEENPIGRKILFDQARKQLLKKTRGHYPAPEQALEVVRTGLEEGFEAGLKAEARAFGTLLMSEVSKRLVELFFATTALKKEPGHAPRKAPAGGVPDATKATAVEPREVKKVAVVGGGLMGSGIAFLGASHQGVQVRVKERDDAGVARALREVRGLFDERVKRRVLTSRDAEAKLARITAGTDYAGFKRADLVIEAVFEDLPLKQRVLAEVEAVTGPSCIFASNTSSLPITRLAQSAQRPEHVIGMHYFSPAHKMPLLEIITHPGTADWVTATCVDVGKKQGKTVIVVNDGVGFYTSRVLAPYLNEAAWLLAEGADIQALDRALLDFGFPVGPVTLLDEVGIDVGAKVAKIMQDAFGARMTAPEVMARVIGDGRQGRKNHQGFYLYGDDIKKKAVDASVYALLPHGKDRKPFSPQEMVERCVLQFVNEAIHCLGEGILRSPRDGDIGAIFGLGFPPFIGGPFRHADALGAPKLLHRLQHWQEKHGIRFQPAPLLVEFAKAGHRFYP